MFVTAEVKVPKTMGMNYRIGGPGKYVKNLENESAMTIV